MIASPGGRFSAIAAALGLPAFASSRRLSTLLAATALSAFLFASLPPAASAAPQRTFLTETEAGGFQGPTAISIDPSDHVWVTEHNAGGVIAELAPYPSTAKNGEQTGEGQYESGGFYVGRTAFSATTGNLYVGETGGRILVFEHGTGPYLETISIEGAKHNIVVAIDNSSAPSAGRIYAGVAGEFGAAAGYLTTGFVQALEADGAPHLFSAPVPYVNGDRITGTPTESLHSISSIAVDDQGNIYVADHHFYNYFEQKETENFLDVFSSSGRFVQRFNLGSREFEQIAIDPHTGAIIVLFQGSRDHLKEFDPAGQPIDELTGTSPSSPFSNQGDMAANSQGYLYYADRVEGKLDIFSPLALSRVFDKALEVHDPNSATLTATVDPNGAGDVQSCTLEYGTGFSYDEVASCSPTPPPAFSTPTEVTTQLTTLANGTTYHARYAVTDEAGDQTHSVPFVIETPVAVHDVQVSAATDITNASATLHGSYTGDGNDTHYYFEYGTSTNYGAQTAPPPGLDQGEATGTQALSAPIGGLSPDVLYHFRLAAHNKYGTTYSPDRTFRTFRSPSINSLTASHVTATSADLEATIDPQGFPTTYQFEYGPTPEYGSLAPVPAGELGEELGSAHSVLVPIAELQQGVTYHFRLIAENRWGTVTSEDQTFEYFPPSCPNSEVRQQTGANFLPDCRAYELVSPGDANGTLLYAAGPSTGQATSPARFAFTGAFSSLSGADTVETAGDLYVSTRTSAGWLTNYVGLPASQAGCMAGPPTGPTGYTLLLEEEHKELANRDVLADPSMTHLLSWFDGPAMCMSGKGTFNDSDWRLAPPSNAPYLWNAGGELEMRLPSGIGTSAPALEPFQCPYENAVSQSGECTGETTASGNLEHLVFSSRAASFAENEAHDPHTPGLTQPPGSAYDNDIAAATTKLVSVLPNGEDIPQDPAFASIPRQLDNTATLLARGGAEEFIRFPAISTDGSHILMSTATAPSPVCNKEAPGPCPTYLEDPLHLYLRVDDAVTYEIAGGAAVNFVDMTPDGTRLYFTSTEQLLPEDHDTSRDLYEWTQEGAEQEEAGHGHALTLLSIGNRGDAGSTDACEPALVTVPKVVGASVEEHTLPWTEKCGVAPYSARAYSWIRLHGNGHSDTSVAPQNGDVYFYSPEQLDGDLGILGDANLYDYREGRPHFVAALPPQPACGRKGLSGPEGVCSEGPIARLQVTPDDSRASFLTGARLTAYDNAGHLEMYSYTPASGALVCDSCRPDGQPPTSDAAAAQNGLFMTDDGRTFFSTAEPLVPQDTNEAIDVYEYSQGRPHLISLGTGVGGPTTKKDAFGNPPPPSQAGLVGVSADGADVYFATYDSLIPADHNGNFLRFYDARTNGGFPLPPPRLPCAAAEECHGPGTEAPTLPTAGTTAGLTGGNAGSKRHRHKAPRHKRSHHRHHRPARRGAGARR